MDTRKRLNQAKRSEYYGNIKLPLSMKLSYRFESSIKHLLYILPTWRRNKIDNTLKPIFEIGERVTTSHGNGTVIKNYKAIQSDGMGGFIEVDVRYDTAPIEATRYPDVGHYNQIFLEKEKP